MILRDGNRIIVQGPITIANVVEIIEQGANLFDRTDLIIDLEQVTKVDSSAISMLLEWQRKALNNNQKLCFSNLSDSLKNLTQLYGVSELVPLV
jgi:phospholipid transport system transporter-binding protein